MDNFSEFLAWERASRDCIDFKTIYVDMTGDLCAGLLLSQIIFWHLRDRNGRSKLRVRTADGGLWLVKACADWWPEIRLTEKQARRALRILKEKGLVDTEIHRFAGTPKTHIHLRQDAFLTCWREATKTAHDLVESRLALEGKSEMPEEAELNCPGGQNHNIDYAETKETETTTSCDAVAADLFDRNLDALSQLGITEPKRSQLAALPHVSPEYVRAIGESYQELRVQLQDEGRELGLGYLVVQIEKGGPVPSRNGHGRRRRRDTLFSTSEERRQKYRGYLGRGPLAVTTGCGEAVCGQREPADSLQLTPASDQV